MTEKPRETQAKLHVVELKEKVNNSSLMKHRTLQQEIKRIDTAGPPSLPLQRKPDERAESFSRCLSIDIFIFLYITITGFLSGATEPGPLRSGERNHGKATAGRRGAAATAGTREAVERASELVARLLAGEAE